MKRWLALLVCLTAFASLTDFSLAGFVLNRTATTSTLDPGSPIVTVIPGNLAPQAQTPSMPSVSTDGPRCLDASWGAGCNVATQHCIQPTVGTPLESCQPPLQLVVTGGSGNGTTATINYTSYANYSFPVGTQLNVLNAVQSNWSTPTIQVTSESSTASPNTVTLGCTGTNCASNFFVGETIYVGGVTGTIGSTSTDPSFGWSSGNLITPNGQWTVSAATATSITYSTGVNAVTGTLQLLRNNYSGTVTAPWVVTGSSCVGTVCSVTFNNPNSCASNCVNSSTQIVAGQTDDTILAWDYGEQVPFSTQTGDAQFCVSMKHISPGQFVAFEANGGTFVKATTPITDPNGAGSSGLTVNYTVYCGKVAASSVPDGELEVRAIGCTYAGYCGQLSSVIAVDGNSSSTYFQANNHGEADFKLVGTTTSTDSVFQNYNWQLFNAGINVTGGSGAGSGFFNLTFTQPGTLPTIPVGTTVGVSGVVTNNSCTVTGGSSVSGVSSTLTYSGGCVFPTGSSVTIAGVTITGGNGYAWNGTVPAITSGGTSSITFPNASTSTYASGGTITANWNGNCVVGGTATSGQITCPTTDAATTWASGGSITSQGNLYCVVGGNGDQPTPFDPSITFSSQMNTDSFQLIPAVAGQCTEVRNTTGCLKNPCGLTPSKTETLWLWRKDAGIDERLANSFQSGMNNNGSLFLYMNSKGTIKATNAYVDSWNTGAGGTTCIGSPVTAGSTLTPYSGSLCSDLSRAQFSLVPKASGGSQSLATDASGSGCLIFQNTNNTVAPAFYVGEPVEFTGLDKNSSPALSQYSLYWIVAVGLHSVGTPTADGVAIATTPTGTCLQASSEVAANVSSPVLFGDLGFDSLLLECNTTVTVPCSNSNPETYANKVTASGLGVLTYYARSGWMSIAPDTADGATINNTTVIKGVGGWFGTGISQGGRIRFADSSIQTELALTAAVAVGPTPGVTTVTGGSLVGSSETLNFTAPPLVAGHQPQFQAVTATGSPGQGVVISGMTPSSWNCGTSTAPCNVVSSTSTSITITNASASGSFSGGGSILPENLIVEFPQGTFAFDAVANPLGLCAINNISINTGSAKACLVGYQTAGATYSGTNSSAFPFYLFAAATGHTLETNLSRTSNCLPAQTGQNSPGSFSTVINTITNGTGSNNDIVTLFWTGAATLGLQAFNYCGTGPFYFANSTLVLTGSASSYTTDVWEDGDKISGPTWGADFDGGKGEFISGSKGAYYATNSVKSNAEAAFESASYVWGSQSIANEGLCINNTENVFSVQCLSGETVIPTSLGGGGNMGAGENALPITASIDINGNPVTCSGSPCIASAALSDSGFGTVTVGVATGTLNRQVTAGWDAFIMCGWQGTAPITGTEMNNANPALSTYNNATNPATVTLSGAITGSCLLTNNPVAILYNTIHIDFDFFAYDADSPPQTTTAPYAHLKDFIQENAQCVKCGTVEGFLTQGANYYNIALADSNIQITQNAIPGGLSFIAFQPVGGNAQTMLVENTNLFGNLGFNFPNTTSSIFSLYFINSDGGFSTNFPAAAPLDPLHSGFWGATANTMNPANNAAAFGGSAANVITWPTAARATDPTSGAPTVASPPWSGSLGACPWFCAATDTGLGSL